MVDLANVSYCKLVGRFQVFVGDSGGDSDDLPNFLPLTGSGVITPEIQDVRNVSEGHKSQIFIDSIPVQIDVDGDLSQGGRKYVMLVVPQYPISPENFKYSITLNLSAPDTTFVPTTYGPILFPVVKNGVVNLSDL